MKKVILLSSLLVLAGCSSTTQESGKKKAGKQPVSSLTYSVSKGSIKSKSRLNSVHSLQQAYQRWRGVPYRFGGTDGDGMDCSAFTQTMYQEVYDVSLPRSTYEQVEVGRPIAKDELQPGDIVFFRTGRSSRHNGVYVGGGKFAHASSSVGVTISRLDNVYWRSRYWQARRMIDD
ncbi:NlpC/P60 family protein [Oceanisphaera sp.]|uniref:NlpC/P60 family protein n=1 Tax=Oceanisphaera sp. TaxID=1929979 RepID=UPI003C75C0D5